MEFTSKFTYVVSAIILMFLSFIIFLKKRYTLKPYLVFTLLYAMTAFFIGEWLFPLNVEFSSRLTSYYNTFSIIPFKNLITSSAAERSQWIFFSIIRRTVFSTGVSVIYGFFIPMLSKRKSYPHTLVVTLGIMYGIQILMIAATLAGAVEKQYDTSMFIFEIAGVSVGYFAYRFISERIALKKAGKGREQK